MAEELDALKVKPGDSITADVINRIIDAIKDLEKRVSDLETE